MVFVAYEFGEWIYRTRPEGYGNQRRHDRIFLLAGGFALGGLAAIIFWLGKTLLKYLGISVVRAPKNSGIDQKS
jgi:hypothetical protein